MVFDDTHTRVFDDTHTSMQDAVFVRDSATRFFSALAPSDRLRIGANFGWGRKVSSALARLRFKITVSEDEIDLESGLLMMPQAVLVAPATTGPGSTDVPLPLRPRVHCIDRWQRPELAYVKILGVDVIRVTAKTACCLSRSLMVSPVAPPPVTPMPRMISGRSLRFPASESASAVLPARVRPMIC